MPLTLPKIISEIAPASSSCGGLLPLLLGRRGLGRGGRLLVRLLFHWQLGRGENSPSFVRAVRLRTPKTRESSPSPPWDPWEERAGERRPSSRASAQVR